jgi:gentisate 1,2-dioxygenase
VFHLIEGSVDVHIGSTSPEVSKEGQSFTLAEADTCCAPGYTAVDLANRSTDRSAFLFIADETPLHRKLGVFENRG